MFSLLEQGSSAALKSEQDVKFAESIGYDLDTDRNSFNDDGNVKLWRTENEVNPIRESDLEWLMVL